MWSFYPMTMLYHATVRSRKAWSRFCDMCDCEVSICPCIKCYDSNASFQSRIPVHKTQLTRMGGMDGT